MLLKHQACSLPLYRASVRSRKKVKFCGIFRDKITGKSADFVGTFEANLAGKQLVKKTADFVVIFRANFARNRSVLHQSEQRF